MRAGVGDGAIATKQRMNDGHTEPVVARQTMDGRETRHDLSAFAQRALVAGAVAALVVLVLMLFWYGGRVLLLGFATVLAGVFFHSMADWLRKHSPLSGGWSLTVVVLALLALTVASGWLFAASIVEQVRQVVEQLPQAVAQARETIARSEWARQVMERLSETVQGGGSGSILGAAGGLFTTTLGGLVDFTIVLIAGLYVAADHRTYSDGLLRLVPIARRDRVREVLGALGHTLRWWLVGRFLTMVVNGVLSGIGLWLLGIPLALGLGLLTALLNFIPNIGPILSMIPAVLLALAEGPDKALYVLVLYLVLQNLEGFVLEPLVQQRTVALPAAIVIGSQVLLGVLLGSLGVLLATPLIACLFVLVKLLYIRDTLGDTIDVAGDGRA